MFSACFSSLQPPMNLAHDDLLWHCSRALISSEQAGVLVGNVRRGGENTRQERSQGSLHARLCLARPVHFKGHKVLTQLALGDSKRGVHSCLFWVSGRDRECEVQKSNVKRCRSLSTISVSVRARHALELPPKYGLVPPVQDISLSLR